MGTRELSGIQIKTLISFISEASQAANNEYQVTFGGFVRELTNCGTNASQIGLVFVCIHVFFLGEQLNSFLCLYPPK